jgi:type VI protein secretion system component VasF
LSPGWQLPGEIAQAPKDVWTRRLGILAIACFFLALLMFIGYKLSLDSGANQIQASAAPARN